MVKQSQEVGAFATGVYPHEHGKKMAKFMQKHSEWMRESYLNVATILNGDGVAESTPEEMKDLIEKKFQAFENRKALATTLQNEVFSKKKKAGKASKGSKETEDDGEPGC